MCFKVIFCFFCKAAFCFSHLTSSDHGFHVDLICILIRDKQHLFITNSVIRGELYRLLIFALETLFVKQSINRFKFNRRDAASLQTRTFEVLLFTYELNRAEYGKLKSSTKPKEINSNSLLNIFLFCKVRGIVH